MVTQHILKMLKIINQTLKTFAFLILGSHPKKEKKLLFIKTALLV
nr:MAG TPA: hypothetical protein [Caudoviricetes sp.]